MLLLSAMVLMEPAGIHAALPIAPGYIALPGLAMNERRPIAMTWIPGGDIWHGGVTSWAGDRAKVPAAHA